MLLTYTVAVCAVMRVALRTAISSSAVVYSSTSLCEKPTYTGHLLLVAIPAVGKDNTGDGAVVSRSL